MYTWTLKFYLPIVNDYEIYEKGRAALDKARLFSYNIVYA